MTKADLRQLARFYINDLGVDWQPDTSATMLGLDDALFMGLERYFRETRCSPVAYTVTATVDEPIYSYGAFGVEAADTDSVSVLAAADNTNAFTLVAGEPAHTTIDRHYITVTIKNPTGGGLAVLARNYTVVGQLAYHIPYTEVIAVPVTAALGAGLSLTYTSVKPFASVTSITPSAAQTAGLQHSAGVGAQSAGSRLFDLWQVAFDEKGLERITRDRLARERDKNWQFADSGTPSVWMPWGEKQFRVWRPPDSAAGLYAEGWEGPDPTVLDADTDEPPIDATDQPLISMFAAIMLTIRESRDERLIQQSVLWPQLRDGYQRAYGRIHGTGNSEIIFGRGTPSPTSDWPPVNKTVITL